MAHSKTTLPETKKASLKINVGLTKGLKAKFEFLRLDVEYGFTFDEENLDTAYVKISDTITDLLECEAQKYKELDEQGAFNVR